MPTRSSETNCFPSSWQCEVALPPYMLDRPSDKKKKSAKQEKRFAKHLKGKVQRGSGAVIFNKGDVKSAELLTECKRTDGETIRVDKKWLIKVSREAVGYGKTPALGFGFDNMPALVDGDWIAVPAKFLQSLLDFYKEHSDED
jgi:hypothetical protein